MRKLLLTLLSLAMLGAPATAQTLDRIKESGTFKIGFRTDAAPLSFADEEGKPAGYTPLLCSGLAQAVANLLKMDDLEAIFIPVDAANRFDMVANGEIDLLCGAATITLRRREHVDFSVPVYVDGVSLVLPKDAPEEMAWLADKRVGVRSNTTTEEAVRNSLNIAGVKAEVVPFDDHNSGMDAMAAGEISAYFADQSILFFQFFSRGMQNGFKISQEILTVEKQGLALPRGDSDFRLMVDAAISQMYANGDIAKIFATAMPGAEPGVAISSMHLIAPTLP